MAEFCPKIAKLCHFLHQLIPFYAEMSRRMRRRGSRDMRREFGHISFNWSHDLKCHLSVKNDPKNTNIKHIFVRCDQRSEVAAVYDSIRLEKNPGWMCVCVCVRVCVRPGHQMDFLSRFKPQRAETW